MHIEKFIHYQKQLLELWNEIEQEKNGDENVSKEHFLHNKNETLKFIRLIDARLQKYHFKSE